MTRWWWMALGAVGVLGVQAWSAQEPTRHWIERDGTDWGRLGHDAQTAYVEGFWPARHWARRRSRPAVSRSSERSDRAANGPATRPVSLGRSGSAAGPAGSVSPTAQRLREPDQRLLLVAQPPPVADLVRVLGGELDPHSPELMSAPERGPSCWCRNSSRWLTVVGGHSSLEGDAPMKRVALLCLGLALGAATPPRPSSRCR